MLRFGRGKLYVTEDGARNTESLAVASRRLLGATRIGRHKNAEGIADPGDALYQIKGLALDGVGDEIVEVGALVSNVEPPKSVLC